MNDFLFGAFGVWDLGMDLVLIRRGKALVRYAWEKGFDVGMTVGGCRNSLQWALSHMYEMEQAGVVWSLLHIDGIDWGWISVIMDQIHQSIIHCLR